MSTQAIEWRPTTDGLCPFVVAPGSSQATQAIWAPQPGSQELFLSCPVTEVLYEGTRGPGKTDAILMDFAQHVGQFGAEWKGIIFRKTYPELEDIITKSQKWFPRIFPEANYNKSFHTWTWPTGEQLHFRFFGDPSDYWKYHGHSYPYIAWEELTTWPDSKCYTSMFSCARTTNPRIPIKVRATTNPYGVGHNWVKARWQLPIAPNKITGPIIRGEKDSDGKMAPPRVAIRGRLSENKVLFHADPNYAERLKAAARSPAELAAWLHGDWTIVSGGMIDDVWEPRIHVLPDFPLHLIPRMWRVDRSYDHGQSKPFSVGWWAESNGEPFTNNGILYGAKRGDLIRIAEWYGWNGQPNEGLRMEAGEIAQGILKREADWGLRNVYPGPADTQIFDPYAAQKSVAGDMKTVGVEWKHADKGPGSRKQGWEQLRRMLKASKDRKEDQPGLFILERCTQFIRTVPVLPRDEKDLDDVDTEAEDHVGDEVRYRLRVIKHQILIGASRAVTANG